MRLIDMELNNIKVECEYFENNNIHMKQLYLDANENLIFKIYFFPKYIYESIREKEFIILQNEKVVYKFNGIHLLRQTEIRYEKNKILKKYIHVYYINLFRTKLILYDENSNFMERNLIQTHKKLCYVPSELVIYNLDTNINYKYYFFNNQAIRYFIKKNYDVNYLKFYDLIIPGSFQADFFRLLALYELGGIYIDHKMVLIESLDKMINNRNEYMLVNDAINKNIYNAFLVFPKGHFILKKLIDYMCKKIHNRHLVGGDIFEFGPSFFKRHYDFGDMYDTFFNIHIFENYIYNPYCSDIHNKKYMYSAYKEYHNINNYYSNPINHYARMYENNQIYFRPENIKKYNNYTIYIWNHNELVEFEFELVNKKKLIIHCTDTCKVTFRMKFVHTLENIEKVFDTGIFNTKTKIIEI